MTFVVLAALMLLPPRGACSGGMQVQEEGYLLWELRVVESGLKDASGKDWNRDKETTLGKWKCPDTTHVNITHPGLKSAYRCCRR